MENPQRDRVQRDGEPGGIGRMAQRDASRGQATDYAPILPSSTGRPGFGGRAAGRRIVITSTAKGGVGKTFFLVNLTDWLQEKNMRSIVFDSDWSSGTLTRFLPDSRFVTAEEGEGFQEILTALDEVDLVLIDGSAAALPELLAWIENSNLAGDQSESDVSITLACMVEEDKDTIFQAGELCRRFGANVEWLVVRTLKTGPATEIYDNSKTRQELLRLGAGEITIARLPWNLLSIMQRTSKSLSGMMQDKSLSLLERHRLRSYQERLFEQFAAMEPVLLPRLNPRAGAAGRHGNDKGAIRPRIAPEEV